MSDNRTIGRVEAIHIALEAAAEMVAVPEVTAIAGVGIEKDRYAKSAGTFSSWPKDHEFTLIEAEAIEALNKLPGISIMPGASRRNVTTRGVSLNNWIDKEFTIGQARCRGTRLCQPCAHLQKMLGIDELVKIMHNRGGLRAVIINGGKIRVGDTIEI
jgi:MOSC domain-containing protein YiiM